MSDLQDLIATNAVKAYNQGFERGEASERERIVALLIGVAVDQDALLELSRTKEQTAVIKTVIATTYQLMALIRGEQK